ncbi:MAG TPA: KUP/HAK/KT family potassium transporter [Xanthobacteraceae bacterium]|jgi:KUP system potassium uptake protein|nr:KUP/HAK/KT family potassium transporter [Xanthobacteraceae bacterium]
MTSVSPEEIHEPVVPHVARTGLALSGLAALGIVFGDIGTSPLYTLKTAFDFLHGDPTPDRILGILSLLIWTLFMITTVKYVVVAMSIDNEGEGGILALMSLLGAQKHSRPLIVFAGLLGAALIYGDGAITPAISVLSALEGLNIAAPSFEQYVLPSAVVILAALFAVQPLGTARIGSAFGPIMAVWFVTIGLLGLWGIAKDPWVLLALNPLYGVRLLANNGYGGFLVLGGIFLCVTGAEALYADMGHFGKRPIRAAWSWIVFPCLVLNYAGQCAIALNGASISDNIFYRLCPEPLLIPLVGLATVATIIASQSIVTGAFSMTRQAIQLGWLPRLHIKQTSEKGYGQIYVGVVNWLLMIVTIALTLLFQKSDNLAAAYGIAVSATMLMTSFLLFIAMREVLRWSLLASAMLAAVFIFIDAGFFAANSLKIAEGGYVPLLLAGLVYGAMLIWHRGSVAVANSLEQTPVPVAKFLEDVKARNIPRVPGTAVFLTRTSNGVPPVMLWHLKQNRALHEHVLVLRVLTESRPRVLWPELMTIAKEGENFWRVTTHFGFMQRPDIPRLMHQAAQKGCGVGLDDVIYYVGHEIILHKERGAALPHWQEALFAAMLRNASHVTDYFRLPSEQVVEIGRQISI